MSPVAFVASGRTRLNLSFFQKFGSVSKKRMNDGLWCPVLSVELLASA